MDIVVVITAHYGSMVLKKFYHHEITNIVLKAKKIIYFIIYFKIKIYICGEIEICFLV